MSARAAFQCPRCHSVSHNPDDARALYCGRCHVFWTRLGPGTYSGGGEMHVLLPALLAELGIPDTPAARRAVAGAARQVFAERAPGVPVVECGTEAR